MHQKDRRNTRESRINRALMDLLRKKISEEDYKQIRDQIHEENMEEHRSGRQEVSRTVPTSSDPASGHGADKHREVDVRRLLDAGPAFEDTQNSDHRARAKKVAALEAAGLKTYT